MTKQPPQKPVKAEQDKPTKPGKPTKPQPPTPPVPPATPSVPRALFLLKRRLIHYGDGCTHLSTSGLHNSATFAHEMLLAQGVESHLVEVIDANCIDREVTKLRPTIVFIEALWVVPAKFDVLMRRHPTVTWVVRVHSEVPFLQGEGIAIDWITGYADRGITVAFNSDRTYRDFMSWMPTRQFVYLPNFYPAPTRRTLVAPPPSTAKYLDIGCFGAIRPMKNHLVQAMAAMQVADRRRQTLRFHINAERIEARGEPVLKNLRALFAATRHELVEHEWMDRDTFLDLVSEMDVTMQVSLSESFNIVSADAVSMGIPAVTSPEIRWVGDAFQACPPTDTAAIGAALERALMRWYRWTDSSLAGLRKLSQQAQQRWLALVRR